MKKLLMVFLALAFLIAGCTNDNNPPSKLSTKNGNKTISKKSLCIGSVAVNYKYEEEIYRPIIQYLVKHLKEHGYTDAKSIIVGSMDELIVKANNAEVDIFFGSLFPSITVDKGSKLEPVIKAFQNNTDSYHSVFFAKADSKINSLKNLNGKVIAFENRFSTSGFFYPTILLKKMGYDLIELTNPEQQIPPNHIGYIFSSDDENTAVWVKNRYVDVGVTDNEVFEYYSSGTEGELKAIHESKKLIRFITSIREDLPIEVKESLIKILIDLPDDEGKNLFSELLLISKFEKIDKHYYNEIKSDFENFLLN